MIHPMRMAQVIGLLKSAAASMRGAERNPTGEA
jgi:hypothetical protein